MSEKKKRPRLYIYGEKTSVLTIQVPASKKDEILSKFYELLKSYENPLMLVLDSPEPTEKFVEEIVLDPEEEMTEELRNAIAALPKDKKQISIGLYAAGGKFYTNKVVAGKLEILEWSKEINAQRYLDNLKK